MKNNSQINNKTQLSCAVFCGLKNIFVVSKKNLTLEKTEYAGPFEQMQRDLRIKRLFFSGLVESLQQLNVHVCTSNTQCNGHKIKW